MKLLIDGEPVIAFDEVPETLSELLDKANLRLRQQGRGIVAISIDSEEINPDALTDAVERRDIREVDSIELRTRSLSALAIELIEEIEAVLPELPNVCHALAEIFQTGTTEEGYEQFDQLATIWGELKTKQKMVADVVGLNLDELPLAKRTVGDHHNELNEFLTAAAQALKKDDRVVLADLLEYELAPRAESELLIVQALRSRIENPTE